MAFLALSANAFAQTASQITPQSFAPEVSHRGGFTVPADTGLVAPAGADRLFVRIGGFALTGGLPDLADATAELERRLLGRPISGVEVFAAARDLEAVYARAGFVLVRVILPPQRLVNGARLKLSIVDGYLERIETKDVPELLKARVAHLLEPLVGRRGLTLSALERQILLVNDIPGAMIRSTLAAGSTTGATVLAIEIRHQAVMGSVTADNTLSRSLGKSAPGLGVDINGIAGWGEQVYLRANGVGHYGHDGLFARYPLNRSLAAGMNVPLWVDGLTFNPEYTDARTTPLAAGGTRSTDTFNRLSLRLRYAWIRSRGANLSSELSFDAEDETNSLFVAGVPAPLSLDRLRVLRLTQEGDVQVPWGGSLTGRVVFSTGLDAFGARSTSDATPILPLSRQGASDTFQKAEISLGYAQSVLDHLAVSLSLKAQTSFNQPLLHAEQFGVATLAGLSAFDSGALVGDRGYVVRGEMSSPWQIPLVDLKATVNAAPYVYGAFGAVGLVAPTALEKRVIHGASAGVGLRLNGAPSGSLSNASLAIEWGHATRDDGKPAGNRSTISSALKF